MHSLSEPMVERDSECTDCDDTESDSAQMPDSSSNMKWRKSWPFNSEMFNNISYIWYKTYKYNDQVLRIIDFVVQQSLHTMP